MAAPAEFVAGSDNSVAWAAGSPAGGGFNLSVSSSPTVGSSGALTVVDQHLSFGAGVLSAQVSGLAEGAHYYQVKAKTQSGVCLASGWSGLVSSTQDASGPTVAITSPGEDDLVLGGPFTVTGTLTDTLSGPDSVTVAVSNTLLPQAFVLRSVTADASSGEWTATFEGLSVGTYEITAIGTDNVGNGSEVARRNVTVAAV